MKKILSIFILVFMVITLSPTVLIGFTASAENYGSLTYSISNEEVTITGCSRNVVSITIPATIENYPVTKIGARAFNSCEKLTSVSIPKTVNIIESNAFSFSGLEFIDIPKSVVKIGSYAFSCCFNLDTIVLPDGVQIIGDGAFSTTNIKTIRLPDTVKKYGYAAFSGCNKLSDVWYNGKPSTTLEYNIKNAGQNDSLLNATWHYNACDISVYHQYSNNCDETCNTCGYKREALHTYEWIIDKENNCGVDGYKHEECTVCHIKRNENTVIAATGNHDFEWKTDKENNCGVDGYKHEECSICHVTRSENTVIDATGNHSWDNNCDTNCNVCGNIRTIEHTYRDECDHDCNICGEFRKAPHKYDNDCDVTCNLCGSEREIGDHRYTNACDAFCNSCGFERTPSAHVYDNNCDTDCNVCGHIRTIEHTFTNECDGECNICFETRKAPHLYDNDCDANCNLCHASRVASEHCYNNSCDIDCNECGEVRTIEHTYSGTDDLSCNVCYESLMPGAPTVKDKDATSITLVAVSGCEYSMDGENWQSSNTFNGLTSDTEYTFYQRVKETSSSKQSGISKPLKTKTLKGYTVTFCYNDGINSDFTKIKTQEVDLSLESVSKSGNIFLGWSLTPNGSDLLKTYRADSDVTLFAKWAFECELCSGYGKLESTETHEKKCKTCYGYGETPIRDNTTRCLDCGSYEYSYMQYGNYIANHCHKCYSRNIGTGYVLGYKKCVACYGRGWVEESVQIWINCDGCNGQGHNIAPQPKATSPIIKTKEDDYIELVAVEGAEYSINGTIWQTSPVFNNLSSGKYYFYQRYKATDINSVGEASEPLIIEVHKHIYNNACDKSCNVCGKTRTVGAHKYSNNCDTTCNYCGIKRTIKHTYNNSCDKSCNVCGKTRTVGAHKYSNNCDTTCNYCSAKRTIKHTYSNSCDITCNVCKAKRTIKHTYSSNCDTSCNVCKATRTITHAYKTTTTKATLTKNGSIVKKCTVCGKVASKSTIKYVKSFKLSTTTYTYDGKVKAPGVTVKDSAGKTLKKNTDYTVTYASGRKNVGAYKVTIKMKGKYSGTKILTFKINPAKTTVSKLTAGKKSITVAITKKSTQVTGYQIQYSTSKKFTNAKTKTISSYKTTKYTLKSLSAKKTYYVRVRTYKTVGKTKYYSGWSTYKYVKTK